MKNDFDFDMSYGERVNEFASDFSNGETLPQTKIKGPLDPEVLLRFIQTQRSLYGPMNDTEKNVYGQVMKDMEKFKSKPGIFNNCRLDVIIPGQVSVYSHSFKSGNGENRFVVSANQDGEACEMYWTHKSKSEKFSELRTWPFFAIFYTITILAILIAALGYGLKTNPMKARMDGVLHSRMVLVGHDHDPYIDPEFDQFPEGKLY